MRQWLITNKIYFKTIASLILSLSAIAISVVQCSNAKSLKEIAVLQENIAEAQAMPQFDISIYKKSTGIFYDGFFDTAYLAVTNNGGPVYEFYAEVAFLLI